MNGEKKPLVTTFSTRYDLSRQDPKPEPFDPIVRASLEPEVKRDRGRERRERYGYPRVMLAVRYFCKECQGGSAKLVAECQITHCELWPYRMGRNPKDEDLRAPVLDFNGKIVDWQEWEGYREKMDCRA